jgi:cellulose 1,4-beta-cellobiosidase
MMLVFGFFDASPRPIGMIALALTTTFGALGCAKGEGAGEAFFDDSTDGGTATSTAGTTTGGTDAGGVDATGATTGNSSGATGTGASTGQSSGTTGGTTGRASTTGSAGTTGAGTTGASTTGSATSTTGSSASTTAASSTGAVDAGPEAIAGCAGCGLKIQFAPSSNAAMTSTIGGNLQIVATATNPVQLSYVTIRYWLTEAITTDLVFTCDYWDNGGGANACPNLMTKVGTDAAAHSYLELSFSMSSGQAVPNLPIPKAIQFRLAHMNYATMNQADDWSYNAMLSDAGGALPDAPRITAYINGTLAWGAEPM